MVIVARGGGSLADLFAFCDETLCRTVALLRVPVIASVGHHTDRTLIDDVAAVSCSTPTHAAEAAVPVDCRAARGGAARARARGSSARAGARSCSARGRSPRSRARPPSTSPATAAGCTSRRASCARARAAGSRPASAGSATRRGGSAGAPAPSVAADRPRRDPRAAPTPRRSSARPPPPGPAARPALERLRIALDAHDPQRTLERGYALVEDAAGAPVTSAEAARAEPALTLRLADGTVPVRPAGREGVAVTDRPARPYRLRRCPIATDDPITASAGPSGRRRRRRSTYESACARIEAIVRRLDSGEAGLRETLELCQEGKRLVEFCATELEAVGQGLEELQLDALVSRLETGRAAG